MTKLSMFEVNEVNGGVNCDCNCYTRDREDCKFIGPASSIEECITVCYQLDAQGTMCSCYASETPRSDK